MNTMIISSASDIRCTQTITVHPLYSETEAKSTGFGLNILQCHIFYITRSTCQVPRRLWNPLCFSAEEHVSYRKSVKWQTKQELTKFFGIFFFCIMAINVSRFLILALNTMPFIWYYQLTLPLRLLLSCSNGNLPAEDNSIVLTDITCQIWIC